MEGECLVLFQASEWCFWMAGEVTDVGGEGRSQRHGTDTHHPDAPEASRRKHYSPYHTRPEHINQKVKRWIISRNCCAAMPTQEYIFHKAEQTKEAQTGPICQR